MDEDLGAVGAVGVPSAGGISDDGEAVVDLDVVALAERGRVRRSGLGQLHQVVDLAIHGRTPGYRPGMASVARTAVRLLLGAGMVGAGVLHLTTQRQAFRAQVPTWFPVDEDLTVLTSGVVEIALGVAFVALPARRRLIGVLLAVFFVAVFPGNVAQYVDGTDAFGLDTDRERLVRLFFQPFLVLLALFGGGWLRKGPDADPGPGAPALTSRRERPPPRP